MRGDKDFILKRRPGWKNRRARPFVGWHHRITQLRQIRGVKIGQRLARKNNGSTLHFPPILQIQTITGCNASCLYCPSEEIKKMFPQESMSEKLFKKIVDQCKGEENLYGVGFVLQNEPFTDPTLLEKIRYFRDEVKTKAMTFLVTNGTLLTPAVSKDILTSGLDAIHISFNGYRKEDYEIINRGKSWDVFIRNINYFLNQDLSNISVMLSFVRSNLFTSEIDHSIKRWRRRGIQCFIHTVNNRGGLVKDYEKYAIPSENQPFLIRTRKKIVKSVMGSCPYPFLQMSVLANGKVLICTHDWSRKTIIGDLNNTGIEEVWNGKIMREIRKSHMRGEYQNIPACENCDVFKNATFA